MATWRRAAAWSAAIVAVLALAGFAALHALVDPERVRAAAQDRVRQAYGRELQAARVSLRVFPVPSVDALDVTVANPPWAKRPHFLKAARASGRLQLSALLRGEVSFRSLHLDGLVVDWETNAEGETTLPRRSAPGGSDPGSGLLHLSWLRIRDARLLHRVDGEPETDWRVGEARIGIARGLRAIEAQADASRNGRPVKVQLRVADVSGLGQPGAATEGRVALDWGRSRLMVSGRLPLDGTLKGHAVHVELNGERFDDLLAFYGMQREPTASMRVSLDSREERGRLALRNVRLHLGDLTAEGSADVELGAKRRVRATLRVDIVDWMQLTRDLGAPPRPPTPGAIFPPLPIAWSWLARVQDTEVAADVTVGIIKLRNGLELHNTRTQASVREGRMELKPFGTRIVGGLANGTLSFDAQARTVRASLEGRNLLLEHWFRERGSKIPFKGGPMRVEASLAMKGDTTRELARSATGLVTIRAGKGTLASDRAGEAELRMTNAFAGKDASAIEFECISAFLPFKSGRAEADRLIGTRTAASQLLTSGYVDLHEETLQLQGRVRARKGMTLGIATVAGDVRIAGKIRHPTLSLDPDAAPAAVARVGAAIATAGATLLGGALVDAANTSDPCEAPFVKGR